MDRTIDNIKLVVIDVDGTLTDGGIHIDDHGVETKRFSVRDGPAITMWQAVGHEVALITGRRGMATRHRANELKIRNVFAGNRDKLEPFRQLLADLRMKASQAAVIGDDLADLPIMKLCGYPICVADACAEVQAVAAYKTVLPGGHGAVREALEHLLKAQGRWAEALDKYLSPRA